MASFELRPHDRSQALSEISIEASISYDIALGEIEVLVGVQASAARQRRCVRNYSSAQHGVRMEVAVTETSKSGALPIRKTKWQIVWVKSLTLSRRHKQVAFHAKDVEQ